MITPLGGEDDFIVPENQETSISCSEMSDIANYQTLLPVTASLSIVCYIYLFWMYFGLNSPIFKRHPTSKIFSIPFFLLSTNSIFYSSCDLSMHSGSNLCSTIFMVTIFTY
jgi:hypothetical protein